MRAVVFMAAVSAMTAAAVAPAQMTGSRLPGASTAMVGYAGIYEEGPLSSRPSDEAMVRGRLVSACMVKTRRSAVVTYLSAGSEVERESALKAILPVMTTCLGRTTNSDVRMQVAKSTLQGALAETLLMQGPVSALAAVDGQVPTRAMWLSEDANQRVVQEMSICVAQREPGKALALVRSTPGGSDESQAFGDVMPAIGPCLIRGATLKANRAGLRMALASAVYHRLNDPAPQVAAVAPEKK